MYASAIMVFDTSREEILRGEISHEKILEEN